MRAPMTIADARQVLLSGLVIPAHPLALSPERQLDARRQRALTRYYVEAGAGGVAVGVHTTQFAIREPSVGLFRPVLELASETMDSTTAPSGRRLLKVAGICGGTEQAVAEAATARELGYDAGLLSLAALADASDGTLLAHSRTVSEVMPLVGFYLQPAVGGRILSYAFWRGFAEIESVIGIKIAAFNRYHTLDVIRAVCESGRADAIALYTGNDDNIVHDLLTPLCIPTSHGMVQTRIVGGLLGHWAVWTQRAVTLLRAAQELGRSGCQIPPELMAQAVAVTDCNAAFFDAANGFKGCIAGIHEVLRRQGLLAGIWCLDPREGLSPGQAAEIDRVSTAYPALCDDAFVRANVDRWLED